MNRKEAEEIMADYVETEQGVPLLCAKAQGYLECWKNEVEPLLAEAEDMAETLRLFTGHHCECRGTPTKKCDWCFVNESLSNWQKAKERFK
jgi:hypothetical protein